MNSEPHRYDDASREAVYRAIVERRDVRHFLPQKINALVLRRLLEAAHAAPSVGLSQPWRFIRITHSELRRQIHALVEQERLRTAEALDERGDEFMRLKVEGILECAELMVVAMQEGGDREIFGRRTMPQMSLASVACAIQNLWLAARAEGIGVGWVSMFDPHDLSRLLQLPCDLSPVAVLCIGPTAQFENSPLLQLQGWRNPRSLDELLRNDVWDASPEQIA